MPYPDLTFRDILDAATRQELEQFVSLLNGFLAAEHQSDGSHGDIHATSIASTGAVSATSGAFSEAVSVGDDLTVEETFTHNGRLVQHVSKNVSVNSVVTNWTSADLGFDLNLRIDSAGGLSPRLDGLDTRTDVPNADLGTVYRVFNVSGATVTVMHESSVASAARNRIACPGGVDLRVNDGGAFALVYDTTSERWRVIGPSFRDGLWATFAPTWTNLTVGNGTVTARYTQIGKTAHFVIHLAFGSTTSVAGAISVSTPTTMASSLNVPGVKIGDCFYRDDSAITRHRGDALLSSATTLALFDGANPMAAVTATNPFTFATADSIYVMGTYEEA